MSRYSISKRNVPKLWRNKRIYSSSGGAGSSSPAISGTGTGTPNFVISASYALTASYIEGFSIDSAYFTASEQLNVGDTTYYETNTHNLTIGSTASGETGGIEIVGNNTSGKIGGISFHNIASTQATDRKIAEIQGYVTVDTQDGYVVTRVTNINGDAGYTSYETSEYHLWYAGQDPKLYLGTASLYPHTDLGLDLGTSDNRWDTIYTDNLDTPILTVSEELVLPSGSIMNVEDGNIWFGFNDSLGPGYIAWGDELYKSDEDPGVPIVPVNYIDLQQEETLRFNAESGFSFNSPATIGTGIAIPALTPGGGFYRSGLIYESPDTLVGTASYALTASYAENGTGGLDAWDDPDSITYDIYNHQLVEDRGYASVTTSVSIPTQDATSSMYEGGGRWRVEGITTPQPWNSNEVYFIIDNGGGNTKAFDSIIVETYGGTDPQWAAWIPTSVQLYGSNNSTTWDLIITHQNQETITTSFTSSIYLSSSAHYREEYRYYRFNVLSTEGGGNYVSQVDQIRFNELGYFNYVTSSVQIDHDILKNYRAEEHTDWSVSQSGYSVHVGNITEVEYDAVLNKPFLPVGIISSSYQEVMQLAHYALTASGLDYFEYVSITDDYDIDQPIGSQFNYIVKNIHTSPVNLTASGSLMDDLYTQSISPNSAINLISTSDGDRWYII